MTWPGKIETWPSEHILTSAMNGTEEFMVPTMEPFAVYMPGVLSAEECQAILNEMNPIKPYAFPHCNAQTRECHWHESLAPIQHAARDVNRRQFGFELNDSSKSWLQSYGPRDSYVAHMDASIGQSRKLTAVALLTEVTEFRGGELSFYVPPNIYVPPLKRGDMVVFPPWLIHQVGEVTQGLRQTINMGFWGPPFK